MSKIVLEDFNEGDGYYKVNLAYLSKEQVEEIEDLVSKWNPTDEDIKSCIGMCLTDVNEQRFKDYGTSLKDCLAWLEKQSGQKSSEMVRPKFKVGDIIIKSQNSDINKFGKFKITGIKDGKYWYNKFVICKISEQDEWELVRIEPKFHEGDWIVWKDKCYKVNDNGCGYELIDTNGLSTSLEYETVDENAHLWSIADAKDGDVLATKNFIFIFKNIDNGNGVHYYCHYEINKHKDDNQFGVALPQSLIGRVGNSISHYSPATKEQRELLFKKMYEAGYEFDFNKKELKKTPEESLGISSEKYNEIVNECIFCEEKKSKWSEEDDYNVQCCIAKAECDIENGCIGRNKELIEWLKSLKQRLI